MTDCIADRVGFATPEAAEQEHARQAAPASAYKVEVAFPTNGHLLLYLYGSINCTRHSKAGLIRYDLAAKPRA